MLSPSLLDYFLQLERGPCSTGDVPRPQMLVQTVMDKVLEGVQVVEVTILTLKLAHWAGRLYSDPRRRLWNGFSVAAVAGWEGPRPFSWPLLWRC